MVDQKILKKTRRALSSIAIFSMSSFAFAGDLFVPFTLDSAAVMPKGVRSFRISGFNTQMFEGFSETGDNKQLASGFSKGVTWKDLAEAQQNDFKRRSLEAYAMSKGHALDEEVGMADGIANTRLNVTAPVLAWGITEKLTAAMVIPVIHSDVNVSTGWTAYGKFDSALAQASADGYHNVVLDNADRLNNVIAAKIESYGYKPLENEQKTEIGDVTLAAKYQLVKSPKVVMALAPKVTLPTARRADIDKVIDVAPGGGIFATGISNITDYNLTSVTTLSNSISYTAQLPQWTSKRIPRRSDESLSPDTDRVMQDQGDFIGTNLGARFKPLRGARKDVWQIGTAYGIQYRQKDRYSGGKYAGYRYDYMEQNTEQVMQSFLVGSSVSTVPLFLAKKFPVPLEAGLNYAKSFAGRSVKVLDVVSFDLAVYF